MPLLHLRKAIGGSVVLLSSSATVVDVGISQPVPRFPLGSDMRRIQSRGHVRIAVQTDSPGFALKDEITGKRSGLDIYLSRLIAQSVFGGTLEQATSHIDFVDVHVHERIPMCERDEIDMVIAMLAVTDDRRLHIDYTKSYFGSHLGLVIRSEDDVNLASARIAVVESTTGAAFARESNIGASIITVENNADLLPAVESGRADAAINTIALLDGELRHESHDVKRVRVQFPFDSWAVGVNKERGELRRFLDQKISGIVNAGYLTQALRQSVA